MSETLKVLETRRSCRAYKPQLIEEEKLQDSLRLSLLLQIKR